MDLPKVQNEQLLQQRGLQINGLHQQEARARQLDLLPMRPDQLVHAL
jgi:hypothetical protein